MHILRDTALLAGLAAAALPGCAAHAAEAYLCDNNRLVYVEAGGLPRMIRTDPCIARYHGVAPQASDAGEPPLVRFSAPLATPLPPEKGPAAPSSAPAAPAVRAAAPSTSPAERPRRGERAALRAAVSEPVRAAPGTDYRNVRVINASDEAERWFRVAR